MASAGQKLEVYVKAATGAPTILGDCPFSQSVLITCKIKEIDYDVKYVDLDKKPDWFLKVSPDGKVPLIKLNGKYIAGSDAIMEVLEKEVPCPLLSTCPKIKCRGQTLFPAGVAFFTSKDPKCDGSESQFICELDHMNQHLSKNGPYIGGKYMTSADIALAPKLYALQTVLAHYKNWTNFEQFFPALNRFMKNMYALPAFQQTAAPPAVVVKGWAKHWPF